MERGDEQKRQAVLEAAWHVFAEHGFARGQLTAISERCHVSTATIYKFYPGKEQLFLAAFEHALRQFDGVATAAEATADPIEALHLAARSYAELLNRRSTRQLMRQQIAQNTPAAGPGRAAGNAVRAKVEGFFGPILQRCARAGLIEEDHIHRAHALIAGFIEHQTLTFGLVIDETKTAHFNGEELARDAVRAALLAYGQQDRSEAVPLRQSA